MRDPAVADIVWDEDAIRLRSGRRASLLGNAVRIDGAIVPSLAGLVSEVAETVLGLDEVEYYVEDCPGVTAWVEPSRDSRKALLTLTSGAVNGLDRGELRFLLGHELGHVLFEHLDVPLELITCAQPPDPLMLMRLRAWQRAAEISADRIGLVCCGSLDDAARALFKMLTGITAGGLVVRPEEFGDQWRLLEEEVVADGARDHWVHSHPFGPLRMKALTLFAESVKQDLDLMRESGKDVDSEIVLQVDGKVSRMLALMNPDGNAEPMADPLLSEFLFWGGLYVAFADRDVVVAEIERIQTVAPDGVDVEQFVSDLEGTDARCVLRFRETVLRRRRKLRAVEKWAIISGLIDVASADGRIDAAEKERLQELGGYIGVSGAGCELIARQYREEGNHVA